MPDWPLGYWIVLIVLGWLILSFSVGWLVGRAFGAGAPSIFSDEPKRDWLLVEFDSIEWNWRDRDAA